MSHATQVIYKMSIERMDYPSLTYIRTNAKSLSLSIPKTTPLSHHRRQRYPQPNHQHLHGHSDSHAHMGGRVSPQTQLYKTEN